jgi:hypothetical protein
MIDSLRPRPIDSTNIMLPHSWTVLQVQRFIKEAKEKDKKLKALQRQTIALNSSFAHQKEATNLRAEQQKRTPARRAAGADLCGDQ